jgi:SWI/SNF-related matrix-associated actin-dependent regulator of chromatin subfamily D
MLSSARAKLGSRKPTDKNILEGVEDCIIGDEARRYREMRDVERRLDATMTRDWIFRMLLIVMLR